MSMREIEIMGKVLENKKVHRFGRSFNKITIQVKLSNGRVMSCIVYAPKNTVIKEFTKHVCNDINVINALGTIEGLKVGESVYVLGHLEELSNRFAYDSIKRFTVTIADEIKLLKTDRGLNKVHLNGTVINKPEVLQIKNAPYSKFILGVNVKNSSKSVYFEVTARNIAALTSETIKVGDKIELSGYFKSQIHTITPNGKLFDFDTIILSARNIVKI